MNCCKPTSRSSSYIDNKKKLEGILLKNKIFDSLEGELKIVDPYCGERTLDILESIKGRPVKFLTRIENLRDRYRNRSIYFLARSSTII